MSNASIYNIGNDTVIELRDVINTLSGNFENGATVSVTLKRGGTNVSGGSWPLSMPYVTGSSGRYRAILPSTLVVTEDEMLEAVISLSSASGTAQFNEPVLVKKRKD